MKSDVIGTMKNQMCSERGMLHFKMENLAPDKTVALLLNFNVFASKKLSASSHSLANLFYVIP